MPKPKDTSKLHIDTMHCVSCSYSLKGLAYGRCPECGTENNRRCISCDYVLSGLPYDPCPECGYENGRFEAEQLEGKLDFEAHLRRSAARLVYIWLAIMCLCALPAFAFLGGLQALKAMGTLVGVVALGFALGGIAVQFVEVQHRRSMWLLWQHLLWRLNIPWLIIGPMGVLSFFALMFFPIGILIMFFLFVFLCWLSLSGWSDEWDDGRTALCIPVALAPKTPHDICAVSVVACGVLLILGVGSSLF